MTAQGQIDSAGSHITSSVTSPKLGHVDLYKAFVWRRAFDMNAKSASYVLAIREVASFTKAAEKMGVKQPSLSLLIKRLERELGLQLFEREQGQPVRMTPAGRALVPALRRFARSADALKNKAKRIALTGDKTGRERDRIAERSFTNYVGYATARSSSRSSCPP
jgi:molybdenum-dependent DNA-binding transcriptional regulator ModE